MNDLDFCLEVISRSRQQLRYILTLNISETVRVDSSLQRTTNRKWHMGYQTVT